MDFSGRLFSYVKIKIFDTLLFLFFIFIEKYSLLRGLEKHFGFLC